MLQKKGRSVSHSTTGQIPTMKNVPIYEALAQAFAAEGVDTHFTLMGDGNMHWASAMKNLDRMGTFSARHEHCACAMAMGYHLATGKVGVASVTCGPGFTQIMTALTVAARGRVPLVVFAGRGVMRAGAAKEVEALAEQSGALLATTLLARGMFDHNPFSIWIAGGFARDIAHEVGAQADLVVAIGTSLNYYTIDGGNMFANAEVLQIDTEPVGLRNGMKAAD